APAASRPRADRIPAAAASGRILTSGRERLQPRLRPVVLPSPGRQSVGKVGPTHEEDIMRRPRRRQAQVVVLESLESRMLLSGSAGETPSIDGTGDNIDHPEWGSAHIPLLRMVTPDYADLLSDPAGGGRPSPREISNSVVAADGSQLNSRQLTDLIWLWGQF